MIKVGLTGNIGSGKSTICKVFGALNVPVFIADVEAKLLYKDENIREEIRQQRKSHRWKPQLIISGI